jgi:stress response protein YsnF
VNIRKEVDRDTAEAEDQLRREELDVNTDGNPIVDKRPDERARRI